MAAEMDMMGLVVSTGKIIHLHDELRGHGDISTFFPLNAHLRV